MSDSESSLSSVSRPSDATLEEALRNVVAAIYKAGTEATELTVKRVRKAAETRLGLRDNFFKEEWKTQSKQIIEAEAELQGEAAKPKSSQTEPSKPAQKKVAPRTSVRPPEALAKRPLPVDSKPKKRRKIGKEDSSNEDIKPAVRSKEAPSKPSESDLSEVGETSGSISGHNKGTLPTADRALDSELSEVLDETPKRKSRKQKSASGELKTKSKQKESKAKPQVQETDPDAEETKKLQGWLVKCGIRKLWHRELAPYDNPKAKIRHLKQMLIDIGMTGRYSAEKASKIRETRELQADLEDVQAGAKQWGVESEEESGVPKPRRRLARGLENLDFLNDNDGEETD